MLEQPTAMHVVRIKSRHTDRQGRERQYESRLLRRIWRDGGTVRNETLANLSKMPDRIVDAVEAALKGEALVPAGEAAVSIARSLPHGHVAAVYAMARRLGLAWARSSTANALNAFVSANMACSLFVGPASCSLDLLL
jgi:hypothetical protein